MCGVGGWAGIRHLGSYYSLGRSSDDESDGNVAQALGRGEIVAGPTARGVYTIAAPVGVSGDPSEERLLELLRARSAIVFAELAAAARQNRG